MADGQTRPSTIGWAVTAWRDAFAALSAMPVAIGVAIAAVLALNAVSVPLIPRGASESAGTGTEIVSIAIGLVQGFLLTPVAIAVHRFVLLGERAGSYLLEPRNPRFQRFFMFAVLIQLILSVPSVLMGIATRMSGVGAAVTGLAVFVLFVMAAILSLRTVILFPAVAIDARGAEWGNALRDSKGHSWTLLFIVIAVGIPIVVVYMPVFFWLWWPDGPDGLGTAVLVVLEALETVLATAAYAAVASRLFMALANRLAQGPETAPPDTAA